MRRFGVLLLLCGLAVSSLAASTGDVWHPPQPVPPACETIQFEAEFVDVSRSMLHAGLFDRVRREIEDRIESSPPCTLVVVGSFGVTADVIDAQFLTTGIGRERLLLVVGGLRATHRSTNLDEAAKLIELLSYQLRAAYGAPANHLVVRVYSDFVSSPSTGKQDFTLGEYLARRMDARYVSVSAGSTSQVQSQPGQASGGAGKANLPPKNGASAAFIAWAAIGCGALLASVLALVLILARSRSATPHPENICGLLVNECAAPAAGGAPAPVCPARRVELATGVTAVFSTDPNNATYIVAPIQGTPSGELFRLEPLPGGHALIRSSGAGLTVNDHLLAGGQHHTVDLREPVQIKAGQREFSVAGVFGRSREAGRKDEIFDAEVLQG